MINLRLKCGRDFSLPGAMIFAGRFDDGWSLCVWPGAPWPRLQSHISNEIFLVKSHHLKKLTGRKPAKIYQDFPKFQHYIVGLKIRICCLCWNAKNIHIGLEYWTTFCLAVFTFGWKTGQLWNFSLRARGVLFILESLVRKLSSIPTNRDSINLKFSSNLSYSEIGRVQSSSVFQ